MESEPIRALVLSGGGGRGAFHAGVYHYLMSENKPKVRADHAGPWKPSVIVGTSIGAVNGAAIAQGMSAAELLDVWLHLEEHDIQGMPPNMKGVARWIVRKLFGQVMDAKLPTVTDNPTSPTDQEYWPPLPLVWRWLAKLVIGNWINLLDTGPLQKTLRTRFKFNEESLAVSEVALLIASTKVQTGERILFSNRDVFDHRRGVSRPDVIKGITDRRILASCAIPLIYPWVEEKGDLYWDGALVANTPLGAALDLMGKDVTRPAEIVIVMMTPWAESGHVTPENTRERPRSFGDAMTWMLDWMLLSSFRENLKMIRAFNEVALEERKGHPPYRYRIVKPIIVAPKKFSVATRIIDYDGDVSAGLAGQGREAAEEAFTKEFPL